MQHHENVGAHRGAPVIREGVMRFVRGFAHLAVVVALVISSGSARADTVIVDGTLTQACANADRDLAGATLHVE